MDALPSVSDARKREVMKLLGKHAPIAKFALVHRAAAAPSTASQPGWGPLAFDPGGDLLVRTANGVVRIDRTTFTETPATMAAWASPLGGEGAGWSGVAWLLSSVEQRCDSLTLAAVTQEGSAESRVPIALPILTPVTARGLPGYGRCAAVENVPIVPVGVAPELGLIFGVGPELVALKKGGTSAVASLVSLPLPPIEPGSGPAGGARSPDGATVALPTSRGLLVASAGNATRLWSGQELAEASACVPSSGGARVACVGGGAALIYEAR
jgi:hypothetical protein